MVRSEPINSIRLRLDEMPSIRWSYLPVAAFPLLIALGALPLPAHAEPPAAICARAQTDNTLRSIPESLVPSVNALFGTSLPLSVAIATSVYRCANGRVLVCTKGANLICDKANTSRRPGPGPIDWCRDHPSADAIPAFATGHDTIYAWGCRSGRPYIIHKIEAVDPRGFIARNWKTLP